MASFKMGLNLLKGAGTASAQHLQFINRARKLPQHELGSALAQYVQGLSEVGFRGFKLTLLAVAKAETKLPREKAFTESLLGAADSARKAGPAQTFTVVPPSMPVAATAPPPTFDDDLALFTRWIELPQEDLQPAFDAYVDGLSLADLESFVRNLQEMRGNVAESIETHKANEGKAWGGFIEDQIEYRMASLRSGAKDSAWLRELKNLEWQAKFCSAVTDAAEQVLKSRKETNEQSVQAQHIDQESSPPDSPVGTMRILLDEGLRDGRVRPEREPYFRDLLDRLEPLIAKSQDPSTSLANQTVLLDRIRGLIGEFSGAFADPGPAGRTAGLEADSRAKKVERYLRQMRAELLREMSQTPAEHTMERAGNLLSSVGSVQRSMEQLAGDQEVVQQEYNALRVTAVGLRDYALRRHLMLAHPVWQTQDYVVSPNNVFFSGVTDLRQVLTEVASPLQVTIHDDQRTQQYGQVRWDALNSSAVGVYDFRGWQPGLDARDAIPFAGAAYELGLAFALGRPTVIVAKEGDNLPFDIELSPCGFTDDARANRDVLGEALDEAYYGSGVTSGASCLRATLDFIESFTLNHPKRNVFEQAGYLDEDWPNDPVGMEGVLKAILRELPDSGLRLIKPLWAGSYPDSNVPTCFHVMPFGSDWSDAVRDGVRAASSGILEYRRGDEAEEGRIIQGIWEDICRAQVVVVDLTDFNLNVMIELGMAHALGRKTLLVRRSDSGPDLPRSIAKLRVVDYFDASHLETMLPKQLRAKLR